MSKFKDNDYVLITDTYEIGSVGIIKYTKRINSPSTKIGVEIFGKTNHRSKYGYFWFCEDFLKVITEKEYNEAIIKERKEETNMAFSDCVSGKGCKNVEESVSINPKNKRIIDLYFERKKEGVIRDFNETQKVLIDKDENVIKLKALVESFNLDAPYIAPDHSIYMTKESREDSSRLYKEYQEAVDTLHKLKGEIIAMLSGCSSYNEEIEVLKGYEIVTSNPLGGIKMNTSY